MRRLARDVVGRSRDHAGLQVGPAGHVEVVVDHKHPHLAVHQRPRNVARPDRGVVVGTHVVLDLLHELGLVAPLELLHDGRGDLDLLRRRAVRFDVRLADDSLDYGLVQLVAERAPEPVLRGEHEPFDAVFVKRRTRLLRHVARERLQSGLRPRLVAPVRPPLATHLPGVIGAFDLDLDLRHGLVYECQRRGRLVCPQDRVGDVVGGEPREELADRRRQADGERVRHRQTEQQRQEHVLLCVGDDVHAVRARIDLAAQVGADPLEVLVQAGPVRRMALDLLLELARLGLPARPAPQPGRGSARRHAAVPL